MVRPLVLIAGAAICLLPHSAPAQDFAPSWGQPVYLDAWGRPVGGTPLSKVEVRAYAETGRWADGRHDRPRVYVPGRAPRYDYRHPRGYGAGRWSGQGRAADRRWQGYRDDWGYDDDRPHAAWRGWRERGAGYRHDCGCGDVYLYDR